MPHASELNRSATASAASSIPVTIRRRESARTFIQRLHATPVELFPASGSRVRSCGRRRDPHAVCPDSPTTAAVKTELGSSSVCLITTSPQPLSSGVLGTPLAAAAAASAPLRDYIYEVAAAHALRGGHVLFLCGPVSPAFSLPCFTLQVERQWVRETAARSAPHSPQATSLPSSAKSDADAHLRARQCAVLEAVARVEVLVCATMADVFAVCHAYTFPSFSPHRHKEEEEEESGGASAVMAEVVSFDAEACTASDLSPTTNSSLREEVPGQVAEGVATRARRQRALAVIPLCVVQGLTGPTTTTTFQERATGQHFPIPHYLLCLLQRRLQCALMVVEASASMVDVASESRCSGAAQRQNLRDGESEMNGASPIDYAALPSEDGVLADSDLVRRLRLPHDHLATNESRTSTGEGTAETMRRQSVGKAPRAEVRCTDERRSVLPPVSLHNIHLSVVYIEVDSVNKELSASSTATGFTATKSTEGASNVTSSFRFSFASLLSPHTLSLRYRPHFMKTSLSDAPGSTRGSLRLSERAADDGGEWIGLRGSSRTSTNVQHRRSGGWGSAPWSAHSSRRASGVHSPVFSGTWMLSSEWRHL